MTSDFRNILVSNCVIRNSTIGIGIFTKDGGTAERISFTNCTIELTDGTHLYWPDLDVDLTFVIIEHPDRYRRVSK